MGDYVKKPSPSGGVPENSRNDIRDRSSEIIDNQGLIDLSSKRVKEREEMKK